MVLAQDAVNHLTRLGGNIFRLRYYTETIGSVWDDDRTFAQSGNDLYTSGIFQSIDLTRGSADQVLLEQGRLKYEDSKIYLGSQIQTTSGIRVLTISISGVDKVFKEITPGMIQPQYFANHVYNKLYVRFLDNGSLF